MESIKHNGVYIEDADLRGVYVWIMWNEQAKAWEKVAVVIVTHPWIVGLIEATLENGDEDMAVLMVASLLKMRYDLHLDAGVWRRSRIIRLTDHPEKREWRISKFVEKLGFTEGMPAFTV
jgi:hypothetical protein